MSDFDFPVRSPSEAEKIREGQRQREMQYQQSKRIWDMAWPNIQAADKIISKDDSELKNKATHLMEAAKIFKDHNHAVDACHHYEQAAGALRAMKVTDIKTIIHCYKELISCLQIMRDNDLNGGIYSNDRIIFLLIEIENLNGNSIGNSKEINDCYKKTSKSICTIWETQTIVNALTAAELGLRYNLLDGTSLYFCLTNAKTHHDLNPNEMLLQKIGVCISLIKENSTVLQSFSKTANHYDQYNSNPSVTLLMQIQRTQANPTFLSRIDAEPTLEPEPRIIGPYQFPSPSGPG